MHGTEYFSNPRELERFTSHHTIVETSIPRDRVPSATFDRPWTKGWHNDAQPPEPHIPRGGGLPPATMDKIREKIVEVFRENLGVNMTGLEKSY
jgi:hypothetical protein